MNLAKKYQVVAKYDDHLVIVEKGPHVRDFGNRIIVSK